MTGITTARALATLGFKVFPIAAGAKAPPLWPNWPSRATNAPDFVNENWPENCNVGIHCEGLIVVDVDVRGGGDESLLRLDIERGWPATLAARTPSGGSHLFYRLPEGHPGVPNSASKLAPGIDIKSTRGYVVGVGSRTEKGEYMWVNPDTPIAPAPEWLVQELGLSTTGVQAEIVNVPDADMAVVERAEQWLASRPGAVEGQGGDAYTFETAAFLRDYGLSAPQTFTLMVDQWNPRCSPPWDPQELSDKVQNAYRYAGGTPGSKAVTPDDFPTVIPNGNIDPNLGLIIPKSGTSGIQAPPLATRLAALATRQIEGPGYLVKGLLSKGSYAELYGPPGSGKTFLGLDLAYNVAAGTPWMGRRVRPGLALYLAYEGTGGLVKRAQALRQKYGAADVPLYVTSAAYNLRETPGRQALGALITTLPEKPALIVIDTFARALMGGDENSAQDVGAFNNAVQALIESTGACVLILHHTGKDVTRGARGSSALQGAIDTEIAVDGKTMRPTKQRDIEVGDDIGFTLTPVAVGIDDDDEAITSCVVDAATVAADTGGIRLSGNNQAGWDVLVKLSPNNAPVTSDAWRDACAEEFLGTKDVRRRFFDIKSRLEKMQLIAVAEDGTITRRME